MKTLRGAAGLLALLVAARVLAAPASGPSGFHDWLGRGDPAAAAVRFQADLARAPSDPWPLLGQAMLAERALDEEAEVAALLAIVSAAPRHPLTVVALRRLGDVGLSSSLLAHRTDDAVGSALDSGRLTGLAAYRARALRAVAADARGAFAVSERLRGENGVANAWSIAGPFGALHALDMTRPFAPEAGPWLPLWERPGRAPLVSRTLPTPEGVASLDGETAPGDVWYLAADLQLARGGRYLLALGTTASARLFLDGVPRAERFAWSGWPPAVQVVPVELGAGTHRVLVKLTRGGSRPTLAVALAREDGAPADAEWRPATGPGPGVVGSRPPPPILSARSLSDTLEAEGGAALARLVSARDRVDNDRQAAVALLDEAVALAPKAAVVRAARAEAVSGDATQDERTARARAEADWREASRMDPGDAATRLVLVDVAIAGGRLDDAEALLSGMPETDGARPRARLARARLLVAQSFPEAAEGIVLEASRAGSCMAARMLYEMASRRDAVALEDEAAEAVGRCQAGRERLAEHRRTRGELASAATIWGEVVRGAPSRIDARVALVRILVAQGKLAAAIGQVEELSRIWPGDPRIQRRLADLLELSGQASAARAARERALALDGSDLLLRRGLALEDGREVLADLADDGPATIREYEAAAVPVTTPASLVLDAAAVEAHVDGSTTERTHQVIHVHDARGVEKWGEVEVPGGAVLLQLKTRKRDGRVLEPEEHGGDKRTLSAAGLEPGDYLEVEWMRAHPARGPSVPGWVSDPFFFRGEEMPFFRSTYAVAAPAGALQLDVKHMAPPAVVRQGGRDVMRAEARLVPALVGEPSAPGLSEFVPMIQAGSGDGIDGVALTAADALLERIRPSAEIEALARSLRNPPDAPPRTGEALVRAAHEAVMNKVEGNGPLTDQASHVLSRGRGNRTLVLLAVLDALGIPARVALIRPFYVDPQPWRFPRLELYPVAAVRAEAGGKVFWLDPSVRWAPFGELPPGARDAEALVLPRPGESLRRERTPAASGIDNNEVLLRIQVEPGGDATIEGTETYAGFDGAGAKVALEQLDETGRRRALEQALSRSFRSLEVKEVRFEGERKVGEPLVIRYRARVSGLARPSGGRLTVDAIPYPARLTARFAPLAARESPLLLGADQTATLRIEVTPPPGATPLANPAVRAAAPQGSFSREERVVSGKLVRDDRLELRRARIPVDAYPEFARFAAAVDEAQGLPLDLGPSP